ncbi:hypothetical protein PENTCL1PPCAC_3701, partial [Pristionchus entomophagus]
LVLVLAPIVVLGYGPCPRPYVFGPQPQYGGGCRGGYSPWRGGGGYGVPVPQQQIRYGQPYGNTYAGQFPAPPHGYGVAGGAYATPPSLVEAVAPANFVHPTQSTPIDHSTSIATASTTDELADIFDEFKGRDEEELLTGGGAAGKHRSDTSANANLFLQPLQPPGRATPYKPELSASHDDLQSSASLTKDLIASEETLTDSKTGFIPQSKPLPASFTQTSALGDKDPFAESAGMSIGKSPVSPTLSPSTSTRTQTMVAPAAAGNSYAVAPRPIGVLPPQIATTSYVRPYPFGPHNVPQRPYVSPYGGYRPVAPQPLPPCTHVPQGVVYPSGPYPSAPQPQPLPGPTYTRIGGGAVPGGYVVAPPVSPALPPHLPGPVRGGLPPFVDCCGKCRSPCRSRVKRQLAAKLFDAEGKKSFDIPPAKDGRCTSEELRTTMLKATTSTSTLSKRVIQKAAEEQFGGLFSVFCSKEDFSYTSRSAFYCQTSKNDVVCFAFRHN